MVDRLISLVHMHILENNGEVESRSRKSNWVLWAMGGRSLKAANFRLYRTRMYRVLMIP